MHTKCAPFGLPISDFYKFKLLHVFWNNNPARTTIAEYVVHTKHTNWLGTNSTEPKHNPPHCHTTVFKEEFIGIVNWTYKLLHENSGKWCVWFHQFFSVFWSIFWWVLNSGKRKIERIFKNNELKIQRKFENAETKSQGVFGRKMEKYSHNS